VVLYQLLTGERPFAGDNPTSIAYRITRVEPTRPSELNPVIPPEYDQILAKALAKRPDDRYQSAGELAQVLAKLEGGDAAMAWDQTVPWSPAGPTAAAKVGKALRSKPFLLAGATTFVFVLLSILASISLKRDNPYTRIEALIAEDKADTAVFELIGLLIHDPDDHRALFLLGRAYSQMEYYRSSILAYSSALALHPSYRHHPAMQEDVFSALGSNDYDLAVSLLVEQVGEPVIEKLKKTQGVQHADPKVRWNAVTALREMGEDVGEIEVELYLIDLKNSPECGVRKNAVERLGELVTDKSRSKILETLSWAKDQDYNKNQCAGMVSAINTVMEKINAPINRTP
jgi:serine/threonine protein kinase